MNMFYFAKLFQRHVGKSRRWRPNELPVLVIEDSVEPVLTVQPSLNASHQTLAEFFPETGRSLQHRLVERDVLQEPVANHYTSRQVTP
jgi:hypothetical protein